MVRTAVLLVILCGLSQIKVLSVHAVSSVFGAPHTQAACQI